MRNAFTGYSYQKQVAFLLLAKMDAERAITTMRIEAYVDDDFDDIVVSANQEIVQIQAKDFEKISIEDFSLQQSSLLIKGKAHQVSPHRNIIFIKNIIMNPDASFFGFPTQRIFENIEIVSISRSEIEKNISELYRKNPQRRYEIESFFQDQLDRRIWKIDMKSLPQFKMFITDLQEKSLEIAHELALVEDLILIEGKPGVGKSHFVKTLTSKPGSYILYRFWIGNQDVEYQERLKYEQFVLDINTKVFADQKPRSMIEILQGLSSNHKTLIIDGLDHVENYNNLDLKKYLDFIYAAKRYCKVIVLSRPLMTSLDCKILKLENWHFDQTAIVLKTLFHISEHRIIEKIFNTSQGYPIIVRYLAEHYKLHSVLPEGNQLVDLDDYYRLMLSNQKGKQNLSVFLCCNSYLMRSEIKLFTPEEHFSTEEFVSEHPYLFDIKLNRLSLFHDSLNLYVSKQVHFEEKLVKVGEIVYKSILNINLRFLSRFAFFHLTVQQKKGILLKYSSIKTFESLIQHCIDIESVKAFYDQLREFLKDLQSTDLSVINYYEFSLIINLLTRDHFSTINGFTYIYVQSLIQNGTGDDDIYSSQYLFGMYYFVKNGNAGLLLNTTVNDNYNSTNFLRSLEQDIQVEDRFLAKHLKEIDTVRINEALTSKIHLHANLVYVIENLFIHNSQSTEFKDLKNALIVYVSGAEEAAETILEKFCATRNIENIWPASVLSEVNENLLASGLKVNDKGNDYSELTLKMLINKYRHLGSFSLRDKIHNYLRLHYLKNIKIDIQSIHSFWLKYYNRKDYTLYGLPLALKTFHSKGLIGLSSCVNLIRDVQTISEKGYRQLLLKFLKLYSAQKIVPYIEANYEPSHLQIDWLQLPSRYIDVMSDKLIGSAKSNFIRYNRNSLVPFEEVKNALLSNKFQTFERLFVLFKIRVSYTKTQRRSVHKLINSKISFEEVPTSKTDVENLKIDSTFKSTGILKFDDIKHIRQCGLSPSEVASSSDGFYTAIPNMKVFEAFDAKEIRKEFKNILFRSLTAKVLDGTYFLNIFFHPGNVLVMIDKYRGAREFDQAKRSFERYVNLSLFDLELNERPANEKS